MSIRTNILLRVYLAFGLILVFAIAVIVQLYRVQFVQGKKWRSMADSLTTQYKNIEAARGNIFLRFSLALLAMLMFSTCSSPVGSLPETPSYQPPDGFFLM